MGVAFLFSMGGTGCALIEGWRDARCASALPRVKSGCRAPGIGEMDDALEVLLVIRDEVARGIHREACAGGVEEAAIEIDDPIVDEEGQRIPVCQGGIDIDLAGLRPGAHPAVPEAARCLRRYLFQDVFAGAVVGAAVGDEKAAERAPAVCFRNNAT